MNNTVRTAVVSLCLIAPSLAWSEPMLIVSGTNKDGERVSIELTAEDFADMEQVTVKTTNDYVDDVTTFSGPLFRSALSEIIFGPDSNINVTASNDYRTASPAQEILDYDVILATTMNGVELTLRDRGPVWIIYPMSDNPELQDAKFNDRLVWQLIKVDVEP